MKMKQRIQKMIPKAIGFGFNVGGLFTPNLMARTAMNLFCRPRAGRIRPKDQIILDTADSQGTLTTEYGQIAHYTWNPNGHKTILLMHGWESNSARWRSLQKMLVQQDWKVVAIDAPAHGASSNAAFDMIQYIAAINEAVIKFKPEVMAGHSVGGASICFYLSRYDYPEFEHIVLLGTPTHLRQMFTSFGDTVGISARVNTAVESHFVNTFDMSIDDISAPHMVQNVDTPTLIIHDEGDAVISIEDAKLYHELFNHSELFITNGYGHGLQHKVVFRKIVDFISG